MVPVILFPAIDLKNGECVRLVHGDMDKATVFNVDPVAQAAEFEQLGEFFAQGSTIPLRILCNSVDS